MVNLVASCLMPYQSDHGVYYEARYFWEWKESLLMIAPRQLIQTWTVLYKHDAQSHAYCGKAKYEEQHFLAVMHGSILWMPNVLDEVVTLLEFSIVRLKILFFFIRIYPWDWGLNSHFHFQERSTNPQYSLLIMTKVGLRGAIGSLWFWGDTTTPQLVSESSGTLTHFPLRVKECIGFLLLL